MSITRCMIVQAAEDHAALKHLHAAIKEELKQGALLCLPCYCSPGCRQLTEQETSAILVRLGDFERGDHERQATLSDLKRH